MFGPKTDETRLPARSQVSREKEEAIMKTHRILSSVSLLLLLAGLLSARYAEADVGRKPGTLGHRKAIRARALEAEKGRAAAMAEDSLKTRLAARLAAMTAATSQEARATAMEAVIEELLAQRQPDREQAACGGDARMDMAECAAAGTCSMMASKDAARPVRLHRHR